MDWRSTTSQAAQTDLDQLLDDSIQAAAEGLAHQNLAPFMLVVAADGSRGLRALGSPMTAPSIEAIAAALQQDDDASTLRARVTVADVTASAPITGDAINARLEHKEGVVIDILVPYRTTSAGITIDTGAMTAATAEALLW
jgi:hypothetical protein